MATVFALFATANDSQRQNTTKPATAPSDASDESGDRSGQLDSNNLDEAGTSGTGARTGLDAASAAPVVVLGNQSNPRVADSVSAETERSNDVPGLMSNLNLVFAISQAADADVSAAIDGN